MEQNCEIKQEGFEEEILIEADVPSTPSLKRFSSTINDNNGTPWKRTCNYSNNELQKLEHILLQKRHVRGDVPIIYNPPFYDLQKHRPEFGDKVVARCCSCNVLLRGSKAISSNFIKHMKNSHPEMYLVYQNIKAMKNYRKSENQTKYLKTDGQMYDAQSKSSTLLDTSNNGILYDGEPISENTECSATLSNYSNDEENAKAAAESPNDSVQHLSVDNEKEDISSAMLNELSRIMDEKMKAFVTKDEFVSAKRLMNDFQAEKESIGNKNNTENSIPEMRILQNRISHLEKESKELRIAMKAMQQSKRQLQLNLQAIDRKLNHNKLIIKNIKVENDQSPEMVVEKLLKEQLKLPNITINSVGILKGSKGTNNMQNLCVELKCERDSDLVFKNCYKLKKSGIRIEQLQSQCLRKGHGKLLVIRKEILRRNPDIKAFIRDFELIVATTKFYWDDFEGLCLSSGETDDLNAISCLNRITGHDFSEFINVLKHYEVQVRVEK